MAQVVQLPSLAETSLGNLGSVLLGSATDYAQTTRADRQRAELRQQRLADIADERAYQSSQRQIGREERLADITVEQERAVKRELVRLGLLTPDKINAPLDDPAVKAAVEQMRRNGLLQQYQDAFKTGDLTVADLGDEAKMAAGLAKFSARLGARTQTQDTNASRAQDRIGQLVQEEQALSQQAAQLNARLNAPQPEPSPEQVRNLAVQIARSQAGGKVPSQEQIAQATEMAVQQLREQGLQRWAMDKQDAMVQRQIIASRLADIRAEENTLTSRFGVVGLAEPMAAPPPAAAPQAQANPEAARRAAMQSVIQAVRGQLGNQTAQAAAPTSLANPMNDPIVTAENQRMAGQNWQTTLADPLNDKMARLEEVRRKKAALSNVTTSNVAPQGLGPDSPMFSGPELARTLSQLAQEEVQLVREIDELKPKVFFRGVTPPSVQMPTQSPTQVAPPPTGLYDLGL